MAGDVRVVAIFVDVRGFTKWSESTEVFINLDQFISGFFKILESRFKSPTYRVKPLGDGALLVREVAESMSEQAVVRTLSGILTSISLTQRDFAKHTTAFAKQVGHSADLKLGWGIVRGKVLKVNDDWAGHNLNKASRLCSEARPFGMLIDRWDFPELPKGQVFVEQVRKLEGIGDVEVWITPEAAFQFVPREKLRESPEVHVAGMCIDDRAGQIRLLIAKRADDRELYPGRYEGCGGQLRYSESFADGVIRHFRTELGIGVEVVEPFHRFYEIREPNQPLIPGVRFLCRQVDQSVPSSANHSEVRWVSEGTFKQTKGEEFVGDLKRDVLRLLTDYKKVSKASK